jgi:hypothetical protein
MPCLRRATALGIGGLKAAVFIERFSQRNLIVTKSDRQASSLLFLVLSLVEDLRWEVDHLVCGGLDLEDRGVLLWVVSSVPWAVL